MTRFEIVMPKMGESVQEATITKLFVKLNDRVNEDDSLFEIATDKVDSEIPSPVEGKVVEIRCKENDLIPVGEVVAVIEIGQVEDVLQEESVVEAEVSDLSQDTGVKLEESDVKTKVKSDVKSGRFYSPLVKKMAQEENISQYELDSIIGHGIDGRVQKSDVLEFLKQRKHKKQEGPKEQEDKSFIPDRQPTITKELSTIPSSETKGKVSMSVGAQDQIVEMDRMRRIIADHMVMSKKTSAHVTGMVEADVTNMVQWRNGVKDEFLKKYKTKLTFMPIFIEAVARALREYPMVNSSVDGYKIILRGDINIGIAVALDSGNLIVPVIHKADQKNLLGLAHSLNSLAHNARQNKLSPDDIHGGTFTISNFGSFRNVMGTPIINQPQVAILALGSIEKKPAVMETSMGDVIVVRHKMFLSLSYDHRVVDGALGGSFLRKIADYLEEFDPDRKI